MASKPCPACAKPSSRRGKDADEQIVRVEAVIYNRTYRRRMPQKS